MNDISRLRFLKLLLAGGAMGMGGVMRGLGQNNDLRGDRVGWARLKTTSPEWMRHAGSDPTLMKFFREETTLNIDPVWYVADVSNLAELCKFPFLFSQGLGVVTDPADRGNVAEFIRRGGFLLVDACHDSHVTPDFDVFFQQQIGFYAATLPDAQVVLLPPTHDVYRCRFQIPGGQPPHTYMGNVFDPKKAKYGLYGVMIGSRMAGLISLCGWQCGWDHVTEHSSSAPPGTDVLCMQMLVNVYIYAMMQGS